MNLPQKPTAFELSEVMSSLAAVEACDVTISRALDVSRGAVNHWRHGRNTISRTHWLELCRYTQQETHSDLAEAVIASVTIEMPIDATGDRLKHAEDQAAWDALFAGDVPEQAETPKLSMAQEVHEIVNERGEETARAYGPFSKGMQRAAMIFSGATGIHVEGEHMYMALVALKLSRQSFNHKYDNLLDAMAYLQGLANFKEGK